jgi:hypothetical protein
MVNNHPLLEQVHRARLPYVEIGLVQVEMLFDEPVNGAPRIQNEGTMLGVLLEPFVRESKFPLAYSTRPIPIVPVR